MKHIKKMIGSLLFLAISISSCNSQPSQIQTPTDTLPVLISLLMEHLVGLTDTAYLGRVGEVELGASALAGVYYLVIYMLGFGFSVGAQVLMARRNGEGNYHRIGDVFRLRPIHFPYISSVLTKRCCNSSKLRIQLWNRSC